MLAAQDERFKNGRVASYHTPKRQVLGNRAGHTAPAWKANAASVSGHGINGGPARAKSVTETGSRIFISMLPVDVGEKEVEELFRITVGPLKESFLVYNSQGRSKGMAVVAFQRPGDAMVARAKYDGKFVDGRRPIRIEILTDGSHLTQAAAKPSPPSLIDRLSPPSPVQQAQLNGTAASHPKTTASIPSGPRPTKKANPPIAQAASAKAIPIPPRKLKTKKGPKRLKKRVVTVDDLDKEMEDYRAAAPGFEE
ncbi:mRNA export protein mlo3 [Psilocybe cubensis]|uniref:RRM domain-containing protein n=2 Tax=Psilocybe cubensis TaxID=181762 RepID=A0A8H8CKS7_PSICU|nr:mRNA export protein mlo3 [Psilocybe cubensis]KAH9478738.1 mRNA export protein mlo3 [Psilocybe cubensis]